MKFIIIILLLITPLYVFSQNENIEMKLIISQHDKQSSASGPYLLQYNNFSLLEVISNVMGTPVNEIHNTEKILNINVDFHALWNEKVNKGMLINRFKNQLEIEFGFLLKEEQVKLQSYIIKLKKNEILAPCKQFENNYNNLISKRTIINKTLKGKCMTVDELTGIISLWFGININNELPNENLHDFDLYHGSFEEVTFTLEKEYGILLTYEDRLVTIIKIQ